MKRTKVIGIVSVKGGVGKTSITSNLGAVLARHFGKKVLLVDANFSAPNLAMHLGVVQPEVTIHHVLDGKHHIFTAVHDFEDSFHFIPASLHYPKKVSYDTFKSKLKHFSGKYDYILIDASPSQEIHATLDAADALLVVLSPDFPTVSTSVSTVRLIEKSKKPLLGLVLNRVQKKSFELKRKEIENTLGYSVLAILPEDQKMFHSLAAMRPYTLLYPQRKLTERYVALAQHVTGETLSKTRSWWWPF